MTLEQAITRLRKVGKATIRADKIKAISPDFHDFICVVVSREGDDLTNDVYRDSPEEMEIEFVFEEDGFTADIVELLPEPGFEEYKQIEWQSSEEARDRFVELVEGAKARY